MKIKEIYEDEGYKMSLEIQVNGKRELIFSDGEPEDNNLGRNFNDCYSIITLIKQAYEAGKSGEELIIESE